MKTFKNPIFGLFLLIALSVTLVSCEKDEEEQPMPAPAATNTIVDIATSSNDFSILVDALVKADLVDDLNASGPYTVFAPTNDAFTMLFKDLGVNGIEDLSAEVLTPILLYHVVGASAKSSDLVTGYVPTISTGTPDNLGMVIYADTENGVKLNNSAMVTTADINADNGVVHVIDKVLLPPTVVDIAIANPSFSSLVAAVVKAGLVEALMQAGPFTVFAPTNDAFDKLFMDLGVSGLDDLTAEALTPILLYHVVADNVVSSEVTTTSVPTLNAESNIDIMVSMDGVKLNGMSNVIAVDVQGSNGVVHAIDKVILPQ